MVVMMLYNRQKNEQDCLEKESRNAIAHLSDEQLELHCMSGRMNVQKFIDERQLMDLLCFSVEENEDIQLLRTLRDHYAQSEILLVADSGISPMKYLTPDIRAASLLLRPFQPGQCEEIVHEFFKAFYQSREKSDDKRSLVITNRDGKIVIPYDQIYYVEVRERKLFVRLKNKEYSMYETMEHMLEILPEHFLQCHRSFAINTDHLKQVRLSENTIYLEHDITVPLSRSYKSEVKEYVHGLRGI